jgi:hypothetical protein
MIVKRGNPYLTCAFHFSTSTKPAKSAPNPEAKKLIDEQKKFMPMQLVSEYGDLLNLRPLSKLIKVSGDATNKKDLRQVHMISDNTDVKSLIKKMDHNPKDYFLFDPSSHYINSLTIYKALKKNLTQKYYGIERKKTKKDH